jgi:hypothetical protein
LAPVTPAIALITQRSLVQIQPPQPSKPTGYGACRSPLGFGATFGSESPPKSWSSEARSSSTSRTMGASSLGVTGARHADPSRDAPPALCHPGQAASRIALDRSRRRVGSWLQPVSGMEAPRTGDGAAAMEAHLVGEAVAPRALGWLPRALDRIQVSASGASRRLPARSRRTRRAAGRDGGRSAARSPPQAGTSPPAWAARSRG